MLLEDLRVILKVAEFRSITAAATHLDMRTATASAAVKRVEAMLGSELFIRTTRSLRLSAAGEKYIPECEQALAMLDQAQHRISEDQGAVEGDLRIALTSDFGRNLAAPWLDQLMDAYPRLRIRANISDSNMDFYRDAVDLALRFGSPTDANLYGYKICTIPRLLCATPEYLDQFGRPENLDDLGQHNGLFYQLYDKTFDLWEFTRGEETCKIRMSGNRASNDGDLVRRWCLAGKGVALKYALDIADDLLNDRVEHLLPDYKPRSTELWLVCPSRQLLTPAARLLRDTFKHKCRSILERLIDKGVIGPESLD